MNQYTEAQNSGLLKDYYPDEDDALLAALKKKRERLAETKLGLQGDQDGDRD
jgi:hypothetical protein